MQFAFALLQYKHIMSDQIQEIKDKNDIVEVVNQYLKLKKSGRNYKALCPFHQEKTPSFMVSPELQIYKCFGCGKGGDVINFVMDIEGLEFPQALEMLADRVGVKLEKFKGDPQAKEKSKLGSINDLAQKYYSYLLFKHPVGKTARKYLENRGLSLETAEKLSLGYAPSSKSNLADFLLNKDLTLSDIVRTGLVKSPGKGRYYDLFRGRLVFPLKDERGNIVGFSARALKKAQEPKYINIAETPLFKKRQLLYGLNETKMDIKKAQKAIVVEGEFDFLSPYQEGTKNIVAAKGTSLTAEQVKLIKRYANTVLIAFDADFAGEKAVQRGIKLAQEADLEVKVVSLPEGKDPDDCVRENKELWQTSLDKAMPVMDFYFNYALKNYDANKARGKSAIAVYLLPKIKAVPDAVQQTHYLQQLSKEIEVAEEILRKEMGKITARKNIRQPASNLHLEKAVKQKKSRQQVLEEQVLAMLLQSPKELAKTSLYKLAKEDFVDPSASSLFSTFKDYIWEVKRYEHANLKKKLSEKENKLFEELYMRPLPISYEENEEQFEEEINSIIEQLKKQRYQRMLKELSSKIRQAEREGNAEELKQLQEEFQEVADKLD